MVPSSFVILPEFPLTSHGKIDRRALSAKGSKITNDKREYIKPSTENEKLLATIWSELLEVKDVSVNDNFFELGGDSIISIQLLLRCQKLGISLDINKIFSSPTLGALAQQIKACQNNDSDFINISPRKSDINIPLSYAQQRLWFLNKMMEDKTIYNILLPLNIEGDLNIEALHHSFQELLKRHEVLRTKILYNREQPIQCIKEAVDLSITEIVLPDLPEQQLKQTIIHAAQKSMKEPFDLEAPPFLRVQLFRVRKDSHVLLLTMHHLISDAWSIDVLFKDLSQFYNAFILNQAPHIPSLKIQYADFAIWQRDWLQGERLTKQLSYWKKNLENIPNKTDLPIDYTRKKQPSYQGEHFSYTLNSQLMSGISSLLNKENVTLFMFLAAVLQILLSRYSRQKDIVIGFPIANRHYPGTEDLIGFFVNTLPLRAKITNDLSFTELLRQVYRSTSEAYDNQDVPFELLVEQLKIEREVGLNPIFQVVFGLQNVGNNELQLQGLSIKSFPIDMKIARFDLTVSAIKEEKSITIGFEYSTDLFKRKTIERMAHHFEELIHNVITDPHTKVSEFDYLTQEEHHQVIKWGTNRQSSQRTLVSHLFEGHAKDNPQAIAILQQDQIISYEKLNEKVNRAAHYLREIGVEKEKIVAVRLNRGIEQITWILAILKAGGCYLPIDPSYPTERQKYILEDSGASLLLTDEEDERREEIGYESCVVINIASLEEALEKYSSSNLSVDVREDDLAYVIYTSGSSGQPKGVMIEHKGLANLTQAQSQLFEINTSSKILQFASISFDAAVWEWISALCHGATLVTIADNQEIFNANAADTQNMAHITIATLPPSLAQALPVEAFPNLKTLIVAGEPCSEQIIEKWSKVRLINAYGPTECTVCASAFECDLNYPARTIGKPIANSEIYILDETLKPVSEGVIGEIYIGGAGVARGYLNKPDLTKERFITVERGERGQQRLYKSGDLGRWIKNGNIEYIGREDFQVKIRGHRIELGEIEETLRKIPGVKTVVAIAEEEDFPRLVAYIVPNIVSGTNLLPKDQERDLIKLISSYAKKHLPNYMVPANFSLVDEIPLTVNGKIDTTALANKEKNKEKNLGENQASATMPITPTESTLLKALSPLLKIENISTEDNFFALGGDSILSIQYSIQAKKYGLEFSINQLFENPTIKQLAHVLDSATNNSSIYPPILPQSKDISLPLSFAQQRLWFVNKLLTNTHIYNIPLVIDLCGQLDINSLNFAFNKVIQRYDILRTRIQQKGDDLEQIVLPDHEFTIIHEDLSYLEDHNVFLEKILLPHITEPFDLSKGKLLKGILFTLSENHHILLIVMHHMITDGWSLGIFNRELSYYYNLNKNDQKDDLVLPEVQYGAYSLWQRDWLQGDRLTKQLDYWKNELQDIPAVINLPTDKARPKNRDYKGKHYKCTLDPDSLHNIKSFSEKNDASLFMTLLAAFQLLMYRYTNEKNIVMGSPIANRHYPGVENTIGFFVNTIALKANFEQSRTFSQHLQAVKKTTLSAYQNQDLPFEKLVENLNIERNLSWHPVFQVMFSFDSIENSELQFSGLKAKIIDIDIGIAKFDLSLTAREEDNSLTLNFEYAEDLFLESTIVRMAEHFVTMINAAVNAPHEDIELLNFLSAKEVYDVVYKWNESEVNYPLDKTVVTLFEEQAACNPNETALVYDDQKLTFSELNIQANQFASYLMALGVTREVFVPIVLGRSKDLIIAILSVLKAGGTYVPLDAAFPVQRVLNIISETNAPFIISDKLFFSQPFDLKVPILQWDELQPNFIKYNAHNPKPQASPENLAYVIYTSGSTGRPKGVMIEHQSLANYLLWCTNNYSFNKNTGSVLHSSCAYDMAITSLFLPLLMGNPVHILSEESAGQELPLLFNARKGNYDFIKVTPSHLNMLECLPEETLKNQTRTFIIGGERLTQEHIKLWQQKFPSLLLYNEYGPTETTVACSAFLIGDENNFDPIPIGRPIANTQLYILDRHKQPMGIGLPGELYIGGVGVARGYLNREELNAEYFIKNPFSSDEKARLYKTGDLARYLEDGNIQYLGRIDDQIKLRGYRIEPGEIETNIATHKSVKSCVVVVKKDKEGHSNLIAYIVPHERINSISHMAEEEANKLRTYLRKTLPDYMIPSYFITLEQFPLNANGKLDKSRLPDLEQLVSKRKKLVVNPKNSVEEDLVLLWKDLLNVDQVSIDDNFFALGGHSMLMTKVITYVSKKFAANLTLRSFFEDPTIANLAAIILQQNPLKKPKIPTHLFEDAQLEEMSFLPKFNISNKANDTSKSIVLLTGATGFLGAHLLFELCKQNHTKIYCLVRANTLTAARDKIIQSGTNYHIRYDKYWDIIHPVVGDIEKPLLGLSLQGYDTLRDEVDVIYHNAALVNHIADYNRLREANVLSTKQIIKLAYDKKIKHIHYVSTLSNYFIDSNHTIKEEFPEFPHSHSLTGGYALTKAISEVLLTQANKQGIPVTIFRPNYIIGNSQNGATSFENNHLLNLIKGCTQIRTAPTWNLELDLSPVDLIAKLIADIAITKESSGKIYNITNPTKLKWQQLICFLQKRGYEMHLVSEKEWQVNLLHLVDTDNALYPLLAIYLENSENSSASNNPTILNTNTANFMKSVGLTWPIIDESFLDQYFAYLNQRGFLVAA